MVYQWHAISASMLGRYLNLVLIIFSVMVQQNNWDLWALRETLKWFDLRGSSKLNWCEIFQVLKVIFFSSLCNIFNFTISKQINRTIQIRRSTQNRTEEFCKFIKSFTVQKQNMAKPFVPLDFNQLYEQYWTPTPNWLLFMLL